MLTVILQDRTACSMPHSALHLTHGSAPSGLLFRLCPAGNRVQQSHATTWSALHCVCAYVLSAPGSLLHAPILCQMPVRVAFGLEVALPALI